VVATGLSSRDGAAQRHCLHPRMVRIRKTRPAQFPAGGWQRSFSASPLSGSRSAHRWMALPMRSSARTWWSICSSCRSFPRSCFSAIRRSRCCAVFPAILTVRLLGPLFRLKALRTLGRFLTRPLVAWLAMNLIFLGWHVPAAYDFALEHERWHDFEHICFLVHRFCSGGRSFARGPRARATQAGSCFPTLSARTSSIRLSRLSWPSAAARSMGTTLNSRTLFMFR
jgi:hypothetical protein